MAGSSLREAYVELLLERVRDESFPNPDQLDRSRGGSAFSKVERTWYPSGAILDRLDRLTNLS